MFAFVNLCVFRVSVFVCVCLCVCVSVCLCVGVCVCVCVCLCVTMVHLSSMVVKLHSHALGVWVGPQPCFPSLVQLAPVFQILHLCVCIWVINCGCVCMFVRVCMLIDVCLY